MKKIGRGKKRLRKEGKREGKETRARERRKGEGREEGREVEKIQIAKKMLEKHIDINTIIEVTGLTKEKIESL